MESIKSKLEEAFNLISTIAVKGGDVEVMARGKALLRLAYAELEAKEKENADGQTD